MSQSLDRVVPRRLSILLQKQPSSRFFPVLILIPILLQLVLSIYRLKSSWDDAAITAAFSRTWAQTGRIALTPSSPIVEGYSSLSWFLCLAVPAAWTHNPNAILVWMKVCSAIAAAGSVLLMYRVARQQLGSSSAAVVSALILCCCRTTLQEIHNGMEMNLATYLFLLLFYLLSRREQAGRWILALVVGSLLLITRFEMPFMLFFLIAGLLYANYRRESGVPSLSFLLSLSAGLVFIFVLTEVWRHHIFGCWMPNTVYAKRFPPYRDWSTPVRAAKTRIAASYEILSILGFPLFIAGLMAFSAALRNEFYVHQLKKIHPAIWSLTLGCFLFGIIFGQNWGYDGRMVSVMIPFLILAVVGTCGIAIPQGRLLHGIWFLIIAGQLFCWMMFTLWPIWVPSIQSIEAIGQGANDIRKALGQEHLKIMMADVGGSTLCCANLTVLDEGLLTDPTLAHAGWLGFDAYFRNTRPELVETHNEWAQESHIYDGGLLDGYSIVSARGVRYFLRDDLYQRLLTLHAGVLSQVIRAPGCLQITQADRDYSLSRGICLVLK